LNNKCVLVYEFVYFVVGIVRKTGFLSENVLQNDRVTFFRIEVWAVLTTSPKSLRLRWFFHETVLEF